MRLEQSFPGNFALFDLINASSDAHPGTVSVALFLAGQLIFVLILGLVVLWFAGGAAVRRALMQAGVSLGIAMTLSLAIASLVFVPRPYMIGLGRALMAHGPDSSFPSDHGSFFWSLGFALMLMRPLRAVGALIALAGFAVAWSRIYVGVHFPLDFLGSLAIALFSVGISRAVSGWLEPRFFRPVERVYQSAIALVRR